MRDAAVGFQCPECVREGARTTRAAVTPFGARAGGATGSARPVVTYALIGLNALVFLLTQGGGLTLGFSGRTSTLFDQLAFVGRDAVVAGPGGSDVALTGVAGGAYYRLLTSCFLHFGVLHLLLNTYALLLLGSGLEPLLGRWRLLAVYLLGGVGGSVATYWFATDDFSAGASGAVFGLFAAYFLVARRVGADTTGIMVTVGINLVLTFTISSISKTGHLGGLAIGALAAAVIVFAPGSAGGGRRTGLQVAGLVVIVALLAVATVARTSALT